MKRVLVFALVVVTASIASPNISHAADSSPNDASTTVTSPRIRHFQFHYQFDLSLKPGKLARIWLPVPQSNEHQTITAMPSKVPGKTSFHSESKYGNRILYVEAVVPKNGNLTVDVPYDIRRTEVTAAEADKSISIDTAQRELFLKPNSNVPIDGRPLDLLGKMRLSKNTFEAANQLYNIVYDHVAYNKEGTGWGNGDVLWVCDSKRGNCTDFHSLFISLARSQGIPSRFEIGFPIAKAPAGKVGGYHCWAWCFVPERGWLPVDISEADKHPELKEYYFGSLTPDRVTFSVGRDIELTPKSAQDKLNYFVYPHVEVDGAAVAREHIALKFSYADVAEE